MKARNLKIRAEQEKEKKLQEEQEQKERVDKLLEESDHEEDKQPDFDPFDVEQRVGLADGSSVQTSENYIDSSDEDMPLNRDKIKARARFAGVDPDTGEIIDEDQER